MRNEHPTQKRRPPTPGEVQKWLAHLEQIWGRPTPEAIKPIIKVRKMRKHGQT